jgi:hypothetical protein
MDPGHRFKWICLCMEMDREEQRRRFGPLRYKAPDPVPSLAPHDPLYWCAGCGKKKVWYADPIYGTLGLWCPDGQPCLGKFKGDLK